MTQPKEKEFIDGFFCKKPHENAPNFIKAKVNIKRRELLEWLASRQDDWINIDIKESREGKFYAEIDDWKPNSKMGGPPPAQKSDDEFINDDIPF
jgi:hypothetical protein